MPLLPSFKRRISAWALVNCAVNILSLRQLSFWNVWFHPQLSTCAHIRVAVCPSPPGFTRGCLDVGRLYGGLASWVGDSDAEGLLRLLLQVVHKHQDLQRAGALAGGEAQADGVALSPADLNTAKRHITFIPGLPLANCIYLFIYLLMFSLFTGSDGTYAATFYLRNMTGPPTLTFITLRSWNSRDSHWIQTAPLLSSL